MPNHAFIRVAFATTFVIAMLPAVYAQGVGAPPAQIRGDHWTEESWIVGEIAHDVTELSAFTIKSSARPPAIAVDSVRPGLFRVSVKDRRDMPTALDLSSDLWDPTPFAAIAKLTLKPLTRGSYEGAPVHPELLELTPSQIVRISLEISKGLTARPNGVTLHESAALTIGAFALRESAGRFSDVRWALNRMTAHLAMAEALSDGRPQGLDGRLAEATRLTLSNQQARALAALTQLDVASDAAAVRAWTSALRLRITQDWRKMTAPRSASRLEQIEYARSRVITLPTARAVREIGRIGRDVEESADWLRILQGVQPYLGVEDGRAVTEDGRGIRLEIEEAAEVYREIHGRDQPGLSVLNIRTTRGVVGRTIQILPWGAWAESSQRHLAMLVWHTDQVWRSTLDFPEEADRMNAALDQFLGPLALLPVATTFRMRGDTEEFDFSRLNEAIAVAVASPERITPFVWQWLERAAKSAYVTKGMPPKAQWFFGPSVRMPYEAGVRWSSLGAIDNPVGVWNVAPNDYALATGAIRWRFGNDAKPQTVTEFLGARLEYDTRAMDYAIERLPDDVATLPLLERACGVTGGKCVDLAETLIALKREDDAARAYERAFASPDLEEVSIAFHARWLVMHYEATGQTAGALVLARRAANAYSHRGLKTAAILYEKLQRFEESEDMYKAIHTRYDVVAPLIGFYYRMVHERHDDKFRSAFAATIANVFPEGLRPVPPSSSSEPESGVIVHRDNMQVIKAGFQAGDIIVGLEGFRVENLGQYRAIDECFPNREKISLVLWRGGNFERTITAPSRKLDIELRSHPITGLAE